MLVSQKYKARRSEKNFNNEIGLPLTIIGSPSPEKNIIQWLLLLLKAIGLVLIKQKYPEVLVLEYGIDRPGDMNYLLSIAKPHIAVITSIGVSHYEFFSSPQAIETEKAKLVESLSSSDFALFNADSGKALAQSGKTKAKVVSYGTAEHAAVRASGISESLSLPVSTNFTVQLGGKEVPVHLPAVGSTHVSSVLSALAVASVLGLETSFIEQGLGQYKAVPGRLNILSGVKKSVIIDDTYNAAPDSMKEALALFSRIPGTAKIAVLGDMLELGPISEAAHREIGKLVAQLKPEYLVTVGRQGKVIADEAKNLGLVGERVLTFYTSQEALKAVQGLVHGGSVVLVKGSQGVRMEKITKEIMAEPMRATELLCRQYGKWLKE